MRMEMMANNKHSRKLFKILATSTIVLVFLLIKIIIIF